MAAAAPSFDARWRCAALAGRLAAWQPAVGLEVVPRIGSTNSELVARCRSAGCPPLPWLLAAETQTTGRGRLGRAWQSAPAGAALTFSLAWPLRRAESAGLSLAVGLAVAVALDPPNRHLRLKWPNDIWLVDGRAGGLDGARKLGGILIETANAAGGARVAVIGIGLNVRRPVPVPGAACLDEFMAAATAPDILDMVAPALLTALAAFERDGLRAGDYAPRDALAGQPVLTSDPACPAGVAQGIDPDGALRLRTPDGQERRIIAGEVSVRPRGMPLSPPPPQPSPVHRAA